MSIRPQYLAAVAAFALCNNAQAILIVDTGPGPEFGPGVSANSLYALVDVGFQHLAATFDVGSATTITSVDGWVSFTNGNGEVDFRLHAGNSPDSPVSHSVLVNSGAAGSTGWMGATGLSWSVMPGTYTLSLIAQPGFLGGMPVPIPWPLPTYWWIAGDSGGWREETGGGIGVGVRVAAIPEPGTYALLTLGLLTVGAAVRRLA